jgi:hypothetical protein
MRYQPYVTEAKLSEEELNAMTPQQRAKKEIIDQFVDKITLTTTYIRGDDDDDDDQENEDGETVSKKRKKEKVVEYRISKNEAYLSGTISAALCAGKCVTIIRCIFFCLPILFFFCCRDARESERGYSMRFNQVRYPGTSDPIHAIRDEPRRNKERLPGFSGVGGVGDAYIDGRKLPGHD